jgi:hypothetical protein
MRLIFTLRAQRREENLKRPAFEISPEKARFRRLFHSCAFLKYSSSIPQVASLSCTRSQVAFPARLALKSRRRSVAIENQDAPFAATTV